MVVADTSSNTTMFNNQVVNPGLQRLNFNQSKIEAPSINDITILDIAARPSQIQQNLKYKFQQIQYQHSSLSNVDIDDRLHPVE
eukprot:403357533